MADSSASVVVTAWHMLENKLTTNWWTPSNGKQRSLIDYRFVLLLINQNVRNQFWILCGFSFNPYNKIKLLLHYSYMLWKSAHDYQWHMNDQFWNCTLRIFG
jgi:hypothetical protein